MSSDIERMRMWLRGRLRHIHGKHYGVIYYGVKPEAVDDTEYQSLSIEIEEARTPIDMLKIAAAIHYTSPAS